MSLYSNNLCGLVILVDSRINSYTGIKRGKHRIYQKNFAPKSKFLFHDLMHITNCYSLIDFARVCQTSTEFHFKGIEEQLEVVRDLLPRVAHWRSANEVLMDDGRATNKAGSATTDNQVLQEKETQSTQTKNVYVNLINLFGKSPQVAMLRPGDFYITHHSNLAEVHVLFHVIVDDSIRCPDLSSRHQVILALRNALKVACLCDITTVTLPLLLVHEMSEVSVLQVTSPGRQRAASVLYDWRLLWAGSIISSECTRVLCTLLSRCFEKCQQHRAHILESSHSFLLQRKDISGFCHDLQKPPVISTLWPCKF